MPLGAKPPRGAFIDTPTAGAEPVPKNWLKISRVFFAVTRPAECVDGQRRPRPRQCRSRRQGVRGGYSAYAIGHIPCGIGRDSRRIPAPYPKRRQCYSNTRRESIGANPWSLGPSWPMGSGLQPRPAASLAFFALRPGAIKWTAVRFRWLRGPQSLKSTLLTCEVRNFTSSSRGMSPRVQGDGRILGHESLGSRMTSNDQP